MNSRPAFVVIMDSGEWARKARVLVRSIARNTTDPEIHCFVPADAMDDIPSEIRDDVAAHATLDTVEGDEEQPFAVKHNALLAAMEVSDRDYLMVLDTDKLVLDDITVPDTDADLLIKPEDSAMQPMARPESAPVWERVYGNVPERFPGWTERSTVDDRPIPPYYQAGAVIARNDPEIARTYRDLASMCFEETGGLWGYEQVALGILVQRYDTHLLTERYNFPMPFYWRLDEAARVVHYHDLYHLAKIDRPFLHRRLDGTGFRDLLDYADTRAFWRARLRGYYGTWFGYVYRRYNARKDRFSD